MTRRTLLCLLLGLVLWSCSGTSRPWSSGPAAADPYSQLNPAEVVRLRGAIAEIETGESLTARETLKKLVSVAPRDLPSALWYQEARLVSREDRARRFGTGAAVSRTPQAELRDEYREFAEADPTPLGYFLAARLEEDALASRLLLDKALALDPGMLWAHYSLAYGAARGGDWSTARQELDTVFEQDPTHLPSLRLYAWLVAEAGDASAAIDAFEAWLERAPQDLLAGPRTRDRIRFNLALAYNADDSPKRALKLLDELELSTIEPVRLQAARAVAFQNRGQIAQARSAALAGRRADRDALLPAVQNALLIELWIEDKRAARRAWQEVIELAKANDDMAAGLQQFRAEVHLQRLEREGLDGGQSW